MKKHKRTIGQITIKHIGDKLAVCISGTPQELFNTFKKAENAAGKLRVKHGRRHYEYNKTKKRRKKRNAKKLERCIKKVRKQKGVNPYAVCKASLSKKKNSRKKKYLRK